MRKSFRNSKLTFLLHPYLQKDGKALMFVNISPLIKDESQSINSLKFASIARSCKLNWFSFFYNLNLIYRKFINLYYNKWLNEAWMRFYRIY